MPRKSDADKSPLAQSPAPTSEASSVERRQPTSKVVVEVQVDLPGSVTEGAKAKIAEAMQGYAQEFSRTLRSVERGSRNAKVKEAEFTASAVIKADDELRRPTMRRARDRWDLTLGVTAPVSTGIVGIFSNYLHSAWQTTTFGAAITVALISTVALVLRSRTDR